MKKESGEVNNVEKEGRSLVELNAILKEKIEELNNEKKRLTETLERITDAFVALDKNWCYTYLNNKAGEILNRNPSDLIGKHVWTEFPEGIGQPFYHAYYKAMETQEYIHLEEYYPPYDAWFENHIYPSPDGLTIYFRDITEKKKTEIQLAESEEKYRQIVEITHEGVWKIDENNVTTFVNLQMASMLGYSINEMLGQVLFYFMDEEGITISKKQIEQRKLGISEQHEFKFKKKDGSDLWALLETSPILKNGIYKGSIAMVMNISERKKTQALLKKEMNRRQMLLDNVQDGIIAIDENYAVIESNQRFAEMLGRSMEEIINSHPWDWDVIYSSKELLHEKWPESAKTHQRFETKLQHKNGKVFDVEINSSSVVTESEGQKIMFFICRDISDRKQAEEVLRISEERFKNALENMPDPVIIFDKDLKVSYINEAACQITKRPFEYFINKTNEEIWPEEVYQKYVPTLEKSYQTKEIQYLKTELLFPGVDLLYMSVAFVPLLDELNNVREILAITHNLTNEEKAYKELIESEDKFKKTFKSSPVAILLIDAQSKQIIDTNKSFHQLLEYSKEEVISKTIDDLHLVMDEKKKEELRKILKDKQEVYNAELVLYTKSGHQIHVLLSGEVIMLNGKKTLLAIMNDITEKKIATLELEEISKRLTLATNAAKMGIWDWDIESSKFEWDDNMYEMYDVKKEDFDLSYEAWSKFIHPEDLTKVIKHARLALEGKRDFNTSFRITWQNGEIHYIESYGIVIRNQEGEAIRIIGVILDITKHKIAEVNLLDQLNRLSEIAWVQSHVVRAPLARLMGLLMLLEDGNNPELDQEKVLGYIKESCIELDNIIRNIVKKTEDVRLS